MPYAAFCLAIIRAPLITCIFSLPRHIFPFLLAVANDAIRMFQSLTVSSGYCLDVSSGSGGEGTPILAWPCSSTNPWQWFALNIVDTGRHACHWDSLCQVS